MHCKSLSILALAALLPACANMEGAREQLGQVSQQLADTTSRLEAIDTDHPASAEIASGIKAAVDGLSGVVGEMGEAIDAAEDTRGKVGAGMKITGDILGGPLGEILGLAGVLVAGAAGTHVVKKKREETMRKEKEASNNHAVKETISNVLGAAVKLANGGPTNGGTGGGA